QLARPDLEETEVANWNLDADRGYGYKCWDWNRHVEDPEQHLLPDADNHQFVAPCTPPSQADKNDYRPDAPLKLHYLDRKDPGCDVNEPCGSPLRPKPDSPRGPAKGNARRRRGGRKARS